MTETQMIHIGMINSFNIITERNTIEEIVKSDLSFFAHVPDEKIPIEIIEVMVDYFQSIEMFENCADLLKYADINYNEDGSHKYNGCECSLPLIENYSKKMVCGVCKKRLKK